MSLKLTAYKYSLYFLLTVLVTWSCSDPKDSFPDSNLPLSPVGEYKVTLVEKSWYITTPKSSTRNFEVLTTACDRFSTITFNPDNTVEFRDHNHNNDATCSDVAVIIGTWIKTGSTAGGFYGDLSLDTTFRGHAAFDGLYSSEGRGGMRISIRFSTVVDGQKYSNSFWFEKV